MIKLKKEELQSINGGANISGTIINAFIKGIDEIINAGKLCGSAIRRIFEDEICQIK